MNISRLREGAYQPPYFLTPRLQITGFRQIKLYYIVIGNHSFSLFISKISLVSSNDFRENIPLMHKGTLFYLLTQTNIYLGPTGLNNYSVQVLNP